MTKPIDVKSVRATLGWTQVQLAEALGVDQTTVSNWENGRPPSAPARKLMERLLSEAGEAA